MRHGNIVFNLLFLILIFITIILSLLYIFYTSNHIHKKYNNNKIMVKKKLNKKPLFPCVMGTLFLI